MTQIIRTTLFIAFVLAGFYVIHLFTTERELLAIFVLQFLTFILLWNKPRS